MNNNNIKIIYTRLNLIYLFIFNNFYNRFINLPKRRMGVDVWKDGIYPSNGKEEL